MSAERTTLVICLDSLDALDEHFERLRRTKVHELAARPAQPWSGDVLLAGYGPKGTGDLYVFVGALRRPELRSDRLTFADVERFWHPVVAVYGDAGIRRADLIGDLVGWGPSTHYYVLAGAAERVRAEAAASLRRGAPEGRDG